MRLSNLLRPDFRKDLLARLDYSLNGRKYRGLLTQPGYLAEKGLVQAMSDACEFLGADQEQFFHLADAWPEMEKALFEKTGKGAEFYSSWNDEYARANICANILSQHHDQVNFSVLAGLVDGRLVPEGPWVDYGCGTASLSITLAKAGFNTGPVNLVEMDNQVLDFVKFRIRKHGLKDVLSVHRVDEFDPGSRFSMVYCIDVLEHLVDPTALFLEKIDPLLAAGGMLYLKAPWRGQLTHLDEAPENFYRQGGRKALSASYKLILRAQPMDMAAVFTKK